MKNIQRILFLAFTLFAQVAYGAQAIIAIVNKDAITDLDVQKRIELVAKSNKLTSNPEAIKALKLQVLQMLIDEKLFEQEAKRLNISIESADINRALESIALNNGLKLSQLDGFLKKIGLPKDELMNQVKHHILWHKLIKTQIEPFVRVTDRDLEILNPKQITSSDAQVKLAEIAIFPDPKNTTEPKLLLEQLKKQIEGGVEFSKVAKDFSQSKSAVKGGEIGWFDIKHLSKEFYEGIKNLGVGEISAPIVIEGGVYIIQVLDKKNISKTKAAEVINNDQLKEGLRQRKLDILVKEYLLKLRKDAFIELK
jgi:peptidyl-prolyl cis-trans isomerase SurA